MTEEEILKRIHNMADALDFDLTENAPKIAKIKSRQSFWRTCPCAPNDFDMYCGSKKCEQQTIECGRCHCNLFKVKND